jgi:predicted dehydrogenase
MARLKWGMIGGGEGSQIGPAHRLGAGGRRISSLWPARSTHRPEAGREYGQRLGLTADRAYGDWREMLDGEKGAAKTASIWSQSPRPTRPISRSPRPFLEAGFHVLCEKPMTMTVEEGEEIVRVARPAAGSARSTTGYTGYSMVRHMKAMVARGDLGKVRLVKANFSHGHHADAADADNPRVRWRYDPARRASRAVRRLRHSRAAHGQFCRRRSGSRKGLRRYFASCIPSRELEDDAMVNFRTDGGAVGRLWTSSVAIGRQHGLDIQVFGEKGGLRWASGAAQPGLLDTPLGGRTQIMEKGEAGLSDEAARLSPGGDRASRRVSAGRGEHLRRPRRRDPGRSTGLWIGGRSPRRKTACGPWRRSMRPLLRRNLRVFGPTRARRCSGRTPRSTRVLRPSYACGQTGVQRSPFDHPAGEQPRFRVPVGPRSWPRQESMEEFDDLAIRLADRGQVDVLPARHFHVVQPDQADIARHATGPRLRWR